jgi:hypothetical protein
LCAKSRTREDVDSVKNYLLNEVLATHDELSGGRARSEVPFELFRCNGRRATGDQRLMNHPSSPHELQSLVRKRGGCTAREPRLPEHTLQYLTGGLESGFVAGASFFVRSQKSRILPRAGAHISRAAARKRMTMQGLLQHRLCDRSAFAQ